MQQSTQFGVTASLFRMNDYPGELHKLWLKAMRSFYYGWVGSQDRTFVRMASETPSLAVTAFGNLAAIDVLFEGSY
jgi:hypothetical protein